MIDLHTHLAYGLDDGAKDRAMSLAMLRQAAENGVSAMALTPHATPGHERFALSSLDACLEDLRGEAKALGVTLLRGCEILYTGASPRLVREGQIPALGESGMVLCEFLPDDPFERLTGAAERFGAEGYGMIVAHAERYRCLHSLRRLRILREECEAVIQMNAGTVLSTPGFFERRRVDRMLSEGLVDLIASDTHDTQRRPNRMNAAYDALAQRYGKEAADLLCIENPKRILEGTW